MKIAHLSICWQYLYNLKCDRFVFIRITVSRMHQQFSVTSVWMNIGRVNINVTLLFDSNEYKMRIVLTLIADVFNAINALDLLLLRNKIMYFLNNRNWEHRKCNNMHSMKSHPRIHFAPQHHSNERESRCSSILPKFNCSFAHNDDRKCSHHIWISMSTMRIFMELNRFSAKRWTCHVYRVRGVQNIGSTT